MIEAIGYLLVAVIVSYAAYRIYKAKTKPKGTGGGGKGYEPPKAQK